ncbi:MAG: class I SAM-dependent methyltransferase, partial [Cyanobacteria bacterium P01_G01_bin.49]
QLVQLLIDYAMIQPWQKILDLATGTGLVAIEAAKKVGEYGFVTGVDMADLMLAKAQEKAKKLNLNNLEFVQADIETITLPSDNFDVIFCCAAIPLLDDIDKVFSNSFGSLKHGGKLGFNCWLETSFIEGVILNKIASKYGIHFPHWHQKIGAFEEIYRRLENQGFTEIEINRDQLGSYVEVESVKNKWEMMINFPVSQNNLFPFQTLSDEQLTQAKLEYYQELEALETSQGIWNDITTLTVIAYKE